MTVEPKEVEHIIFTSQWGQLKCVVCAEVGPRLRNNNYCAPRLWSAIDTLQHKVAYLEARLQELADKE